MNRLDIVSWRCSPVGGEPMPWPQEFGAKLDHSQAMFQTACGHRDWNPDVIVGHGGLVPTNLLRELWPCPIVEFCEYYFADRGSDLTYRVDLPEVEQARFYPRCINAATLLGIVGCDAAFAPTEWQRSSFPARFHRKIAVVHDAVDTELYKPGPRGAVPGIPDSARVVTFVTRGLESMRGFDLFVEIARDMARQRKDVHFVVAGGEQVHYGFDPSFTGNHRFAQWVLRRVPIDPSRFHFVGMVDPTALAEILNRSDLHIYLSVPFVTSWSLLNALSCGCVVMASDVPSVREFIEPGVNGLLEPLFDRERMTATALHILDHPDQFVTVRRTARNRLESALSFDVVVPKVEEWLSGIAAKAKRL